MWRKDTNHLPSPAAEPQETEGPASVLVEGDHREQSAAVEQQPRQLVLLSQARQALAEATSLDEIKDIRNKAEAARKYVESAQLGLALQNHAAEIKLRAERCAGQLLAQLKLAGGDRKSPAAENSLSLEELGLTKHQSSRWQREAAVPENVFERFLREANESSAELTSAALLRLAREFAPQKAPSTDFDDGEWNKELVYASLDELLAASIRFGCVYADPPLLDSEESDAFGRSAVTIGDLCALPVQDLAAEQAHLHLWLPPSLLPQVPEIFRAWGFEYCSNLAWVKPQGACGLYWRMSHDLLLSGVRGDLPFLDKSLASWLRANRLTHGRKPEKVRRVIQQVSPGPYLELFARKPVKGWTVYGDGLTK